MPPPTPTLPTFVKGDLVRVVSGEDFPGSVGRVVKPLHTDSSIYATLVDLHGVGEKWLYTRDLQLTSAVDALGTLA